jgi:hypothetical protein
VIKVGRHRHALLASPWQQNSHRTFSDRIAPNEPPIAPGAFASV